VADGFELRIIDVPTSIVLHEGKRMELSQHPVPIRQVPGWPSTGFRVVLNDSAHVERSHNILVPYCHMVEKSTLANVREVHGPRQRLIFKETVGVIITAMDAHSMTNYKQFGLPTKVVTVLKLMRVLQRIIVTTQNCQHIITVSVIQY
jgi:hypothetical protein